MKYSDINRYFESEDALANLPADLQPMFDTIDDYAQQFLADIITTSDELREAKTRLTGIVATLQPIYSKSLSFKKQKEYRYYAQKKEKCEAEGGKFVDGVSEKESKDAVRVYRDLRDILMGYILAANGLIYDAKDRLEAGKREYHNTKEES